MASIRKIIHDNRDEIIEGCAWVVIWKEWRSWDIRTYWQENGDYENGLIFSDDDYSEMLEIKDKDRKAIAFNGCYNGFGEDFTLNDIENQILYFYYNALNLFNGDFLGALVIPPQEETTITDIKVGDKVQTPRFMTVVIDEIFQSVREMRSAGYTEPTHYQDGEFEVFGKSKDIYHMDFAAARK